MSDKRLTVANRRYPQMEQPLWSKSLCALVGALGGVTLGVFALIVSPRSSHRSGR